jgi:hypothetical protein
MSTQTTQNFHFNRKTWEITLDKEKKPDTVRIPAILMLLLAPVLGAGLVMFLPFIGIYLFLKELFRFRAQRVQDSEPSTSDSRL